MNNLNKLLPITYGLNRRFADGNEPFQIATRLLEECGELDDMETSRSLTAPISRPIKVKMPCDTR